uniref:Uncharacterized protein n=1 Tax=Equus asinus TaxID=9793 RepID=A0A9L0JB43_EQUAS
MSYRQQQCKQPYQPLPVCPPKCPDSPASPLLCAHLSAQSRARPQNALSRAHPHRGSRNALLCNLLHHASRSARPRASNSFSSIRIWKREGPLALLNSWGAQKEEK